MRTYFEFSDFGAQGRHHSSSILAWDIGELRKDGIHTFPYVGVNWVDPTGVHLDQYLLTATTVTPHSDVLAYTLIGGGSCLG